MVMTRFKVLRGAGEKLEGPGEKQRPHNVSSVLPSTVLWSVPESLAKSLTQILGLVRRDLLKVTYLDANMILG